MTETVDLYIFPSIQEGRNLAEVKEELTKKLRVDAEKVDAWFESDEPTSILKAIDEKVADRYVKAIMNCGAECATSPTGEEGISLLAKTASKDTKLFVCPSCEYDQEIPRAAELEECPKCGVVIAEWQEKATEETETKLHLQQQQEQLAKDDQENIEKKKEEVERLQALAREMMTELGMKPPSALWLFFEKHTFSMSLVIGSLIIMATGLTFFYGDQYLDQKRYEELVAAPPSAEIRELAPVLEAAVQLRQTGNEQVVTEIADVTQDMRGQEHETRASVVKAVQQMMKGADPDKFVAMAVKTPPRSAFAKPMPGESGPAPVNIDTIGGISKLTGISNFDPSELAAMSPILSEYGHDGLLRVLAERRMKPDPLNPDGPQIIVEAIDELDGSRLVDMMNTLANDREWDQFLASHTKRYLNDQEYDKASELSNRIRDPVLKIKSLGEMMSDYLMDGNPVAMKLLRARVSLELDKIKDPDTRATTLISFGQTLSAAGSKIEPESSLALVERMAANTSSLFAKSSLHGRLALAYMQKGDRAKARLHFGHASRTAGQISETADRISAFTRIAQRYFDVRNTTLANEILAEAEILAATQLDPEPRARVFGKIAMARGYMGDSIGANMAINNAGKGKARQQLLAKLAEVLIADGRHSEARGIMESLQDHVEYSRLELRVLVNFVYSYRVAEAKQRLASAISRARQITGPGERGLMLSQLARLAARLGEGARSEVLFNEVLEMSDLLKGRIPQVIRGLVALDQARLFQFSQSQDTLKLVVDIVVRDPIGNEITATERTAKTLLPKSLLEEVAGI